MGEIRKKLEQPKQALAAVATYHYSCLGSYTRLRCVITPYHR